MFELWKEFGFDAAHTLDGGASGDPRYRRMHGHSYQVEVWICGELSEKGWVLDMGDFEGRLAAIAKQLDHYYLNDIQGLGAPTMENISAFIWRGLSDVDGLAKVVVRRDSAREGCVYRGPSPNSPRVSTEQC
jgi:6-pyruvoyltetrahydropterin/6-carboxytetrahydropterin synthase